MLLEFFLRYDSFTLKNLTNIHQYFWKVVLQNGAVGEIDTQNGGVEISQLQNVSKP